MILDTSAVVAVVRYEPEHEEFNRLIDSAPIRRLSVASYFEAAVVIDSSKDPTVSRKLDALLREGDIQLEPVTAQQAFLARQAYRDFGKGSGHPARLNFGDCFAYALATDLNEPLLFKGDDFKHTDVRRAR